MLNILWNVFAIRKPILKIKRFVEATFLEIKNIQKEDEMFKLAVNYRIFSGSNCLLKIKLQFVLYKLNSS